MESKNKLWCNDYARVHNLNVSFNGRSNINSGYKVTWACSLGHIWKASINEIKRKEKNKWICPVCIKSYNSWLYV